jgi:hypothetical protein
VNGSDLPIDLAGLSDATEIAPGGAARIFGGKALSDVLVCRFGEMAGDLVVEVAVHLPGTKERPQTKQQDPQAGHETSSEIFKNRSTMLAARCHCASSLWSCVRPARVRE